jgi:hypothetical protein
MRPRVGLVTLPCAISLVFCAPRAAATDCSGVLSPCINDDTLWPKAGPQRFVAVGSTTTVESQRLGFGLVTSYLSRPVVIQVRAPGGPGTSQYAVNDQVNGTFLWAYGVSEELELDFVLPVTFAQSGEGLAPITGGNGLKDTAVRDLRFGFAYRLLPVARGDKPWPDGWSLLGRFDVSAPSGDRSQFAGESAAVFVPALDATFRAHRLQVSAEAGARVRPVTELLGARVGTQVLGALGVQYDILARELLSTALEAWALPTLSQQDDLTRTYVATPNGRYIVPAEWQLSVRTAPLPGGDLSLQLSGGGGIPIEDSAITRPRFRFTLGIRWAPLVPSREVAAPVRAAPSTTASAPLGLDAGKDICAEDPDLVDGFRDSDGCPDEDKDKDGVDDRFDKCPLSAEDFAGLTDGCPEPQGGNPK